MGATITTHGTREAEAGERTGATLAVVFEAERPAAGSWALSLEGVHSVVIGRGDTRRAIRSESGGVVSVRLELPDDWLSEEHARLESALGKWFIADQGSKNQTRMDGAVVDRSELGDTAVLECGHTILTFERSGSVFDGDAPHDNLRTIDGALARGFADLSEIAKTDLPIVLFGETGAGKELAARAIHELSGRRGDFVAVNCGAIPRELAESHLFGHVKGAFSGAHGDQPGHLRRSSGGTLLLDEIGDLPAATQVALLRAIEENEVTPVGASEPVAVDLRILAASHRNLTELVAAGNFRADLFSRLSGMLFTLPPLRERMADLGTAIARILSSLDPNQRPSSFSPAAAAAMFRHSWPQNFRELRQALKLSATLAKGARVESRHLPKSVVDGDGAAPQSTEAAPVADLSAEQEAIRDQLVAELREHDGNISAVARSMGKARQQIQRWIKRFGLRPD